ncbi:MAG: hypothetical protein COA78_29880 [Blastopirellula sp.]|nr:MAG: hypothetical protein COA78_29880 [Blastopirellula sp.]
MKFIISTLVRKLFLYFTYLFPVYKYGKKKLRIVMYHGIDDDGISLKDFQRHLSFYNKHFELFWASEALSILDNNCNTFSKKPPLILTFDDGLKNNFTKAAPALSDFNAKGTFYLVSDLLSGSDMLWNHEVRCRLELLSIPQLITLGVELPVNMHPIPDVAEHVSNYVNDMKSWDQINQFEFLNRLRLQDPKPNYTKAMIDKFSIMSVEEAQLLPSCVEIGSHGETHSLLDTISLDVARNEISRSKKKLEQTIGCKINSFCYPNGNLTEEITEIVRSEYDLAVTVEDGFVLQGDSRVEFKRIPAAPELRDLAYRLIRPAS